MLPNWFKTRREELGLTQRAISVALDVTTTTVSQWENGETIPHATRYDEIARVYQVEPEQIAVEVMRIARHLRASTARATATRRAS